MPVIKSSDTAWGPGATPNYKRRVFVSPETGSGAITLGEVSLDPGSELPMHTHRIEEAMMISRGSVTVVLNGETHVLKAGDALLVPAGTKHTLGNRSKDIAGFYFFYPGVEVRMDKV